MTTAIQEVKLNQAAGIRSDQHLIPFTLCTKKNYILNWHLEEMAKALMKVESGEIDRLMILMPPRNGKSELASIRFPAWYLGRNPDKRWIGCSYGDRLALKFGRMTRELVESEIYQSIFPHTRIKYGQAEKKNWELTEGGGYIGSGVGGGMMGEGAHILGIDDPYKSRKEADSSTIRESVWEWYKGTAYHRLEKGGAIILTMTPWRKDDIHGKLLEEMRAGGDQWTVIKFPAIATHEEIYRRINEALFPEKYPMDALLRIKRVIGSRNWNALYQQEPTIEEGNIFKREYWKYYKERPKIVLKILFSWDTAFKKGEENDYSVCQAWLVGEAGYYLHDVWRDKVEYPELVKQAKNLYAKTRANEVLVEDKASGQSLIQTLQRETRMPIIPQPVNSDKVARANAVSPTIESGNVYIREGQKWTADFIDECADFPNGEHDDQVDSMTQALQRLGGAVNLLATDDLGLGETMSSQMGEL